jgi:flagellar biosynthesis protein FliQ
MEDFYFFWNAFNLIAILTATLGAGIIAGSLANWLISVITQINDISISFFLRLAGCLFGVYLLAPFALGSFADFALLIWGDQSTYR